MNRKGFTLVEMLVASALLITAIPAFGLMIRQASIALCAGDDYAAAYYAVRDKMEELRTRAFSELPAKNGSVFFNGKGKVLIRPVSNHLLGIWVELKWRENRSPLRFFSLKGKFS